MEGDPGRAGACATRAGAGQARSSPLVGSSTGPLNGPGPVCCTSRAALCALGGCARARPEGESRPGCAKMRAPRRRTLRKGGRRAEAPFQGASAALSMATLAGAALRGRFPRPSLSLSLWRNLSFQVFLKTLGSEHLYRAAGTSSRRRELVASSGTQEGRTRRLVRLDQLRLQNLPGPEGLVHAQRLVPLGAAARVPPPSHRRRAAARRGRTTGAGGETSAQRGHTARSRGEASRACRVGMWHPKAPALTRRASRSAPGRQVTRHLTR